MNSKQHLLILAGGSGSRLWPLSREKRPKQFLDPLNRKKSMLQLTIERVSSLNFSSILIVCNEEHRFFVKQQIDELGVSAKIITEPIGKNTAPAIALAALNIDSNENLLVLPADHFIEDKESFLNCIREGFRALDGNNIITFGINPKTAHTGYGYIEKGTKQKIGYSISSFFEKPNKSKAKEYLNSGKFLWNSGMFLLNAGVYLNELKLNNFEMYECCVNSYKNAVTDDFYLKISIDDFNSCPSDSIDYAVMEKIKTSLVLPLDVGWSDVGSWKSLHEITKSKDANYLKGDVKIINSQNCYIDSEHQLVAAIGIDNIGLIATKDSILVHNLENSEEVKDITNQLKEEKREEYYLHREVHRPWGKYDSIDKGDGFQVKRLTVWPGQKLSVQMHYHRSEHWVVVQGIAKVHYGEEFKILEVNESTYHDKEVVHALENIGEVPCVLIEVQIGSYLGEDDIVRYEDIYGRS